MPNTHEYALRGRGDTDPVTFSAPSPTGPLQGVRVVEIAALGPVTFAGMLLADMGADVVRIARPDHVDMERGATLRGRTQITLNLRSDTDHVHAMDLLAHADVLLEGFRPGVMERLELGPQAVLQHNPRLVYGRMTGWGQAGPRAHTAGHDINYLAISGALHAIGADEPAVPLNLVGDYGGGALYLTMGILAAVVQARSSGKGQVVDCAICDGTASMMSLMHGLLHAGRWRDQRQSNTLDGAAPYYRTYRCQDGLFMAVGAIEPPFYALMVQTLALDPDLFSEQNDRARWPRQIQALQETFACAPQSHWDACFAGLDACVTPVKSLAHSVEDEHLGTRQTFVSVDGETQPAPAPRFSASPSQARPTAFADAAAVLARWR